jgi:hypothetical protein
MVDVSARGQIVYRTDDSKSDLFITGKELAMAGLIMTGHGGINNQIRIWIVLTPADIVRNKIFECK